MGVLGEEFEDESQQGSQQPARLGGQQPRSGDGGGLEFGRHAFQFLTEIQGGSDVGANVVSAEEPGADEAALLHADGIGPGWWRLSGEKWFCSVIDASLFLDHKATPENTKLSALDKSFIRQMYPK